MPRICLHLAYTGTRYQGWQLQQAAPTIQGTLEKALQRLCASTVRVHGSGRTDSGVHAIGQVAHFDVPAERAHIPWQKALNAILPDDIAVLAAQTVPESFHARFSAQGKLYKYTIWTETRYVLPQRTPFVWPVRAKLDMPNVFKAAELLVGTHDFAAFQNAGTDVQNTIRTLKPIRILQDPNMPEIHLFFEADGFLKQMVRNLTGLLFAVGIQKFPPEKIPVLLRSGDRTQAPGTAPAKGLCLEEVFYPDFEAQRP